jgi:hypothetical protein
MTSRGISRNSSKRYDIKKSVQKNLDIKLNELKKAMNEYRVL